MLIFLKVLISALAIVAVSEIVKRGGTFWGGVLASLPLTSLLAFIWIYAETKDTAKIAALSWSVFWLVISSLLLFALLPVLLRKGVTFPVALLIASAAAAAAYFVMVAGLRKFGVAL